MSNGKAKRKGRRTPPPREQLLALAASTDLYIDAEGHLRTSSARRALVASKGDTSGWKRLVPSPEGERVLALRRLREAVRSDARAKLGHSLTASQRNGSLAGKGWYGRRR